MDPRSYLVIAGLVLGVYGLVLWLAIAYWALQDARARSESWSFHLFAMGINILVPFLGLVVYLLVRPGMTLSEQRVMALEAEVLAGGAEAEVEVRPCPACGREVESDMVLCPYCHARFAKRCPKCERTVRLGWAVCPYCAAHLGSVSRAAGQH